MDYEAVVMIFLPSPYGGTPAAAPLLYPLVLVLVKDTNPDVLSIAALKEISDLEF